MTGANRGLGYETCSQLAQLGLTVILSARDVTKGEVATKQLIERGLDVIFYELQCLKSKPYEQNSTSSRTKFW